MEESVQLKLMGITYNQIENGVYALILEDPITKKRLAIVIGYPEAQSIECHLRGVKTSRPLSHDTMAAILQQLGGKLLRVDIHRLPAGPYAGKLSILTEYGEVREVDARSSDAVALAIRVGAPIYTSLALLEKEGYVPRPGKEAKENNKRKSASARLSASGLSISELEALLEKYVAEENYEEAAKIKQEIDLRKSGDNTQ